MTPRYDVILTSPPFFDVEEYKGVKAPDNYDRWLGDFLVPLFALCRQRLKSGGKLAMYTDNFRRNDIKKIAEEAGFVPCLPVCFKMGYTENFRLQKTTRTVDVLVWR